MLRKLLIVPLIAVGVVVFVLLVRGRDAIPTRPVEERAAPVRVLTVPRAPVVPRALGYGEVRPGRVWQAVPQVGGRIIELSDRVEEGSFAEKDAVLLRIDRADYDLAVSRVEARIAALEAQLRENATRSKTIESSLAIERSSLEFAETELQRAKDLVADRTVSRAELDREERNVLAQKLRVQEIENTRALLEPQRDVLAAQLRQERSQLERARLDVERTVIRAPFDCRIGAVAIEEDQVVQPGQQLFGAEGIEASEVTAWLPIQGMRHVLAAGAAGPAVLGRIEDVPERFGLTATVRASAGTISFHWSGEVVRIRGIDSRTRAVGVDVRVPMPYEGAIPGRKPPLVPGFHVEVEIRATALTDCVLVPRSSLHGDRVRLVDADGRLELRDVKVRFSHSEHAVVTAGLTGGEVLVLTDLMPAVHGMRLAPTDDPDALAELLLDAAPEAKSEAERR